MFTNQPELSKKNLSNLIAGRLVTDTLLRGLVPHRNNQETLALCSLLGGSTMAPPKKMVKRTCLLFPSWLRSSSKKLNEMTKQTAPCLLRKNCSLPPPTQLDLCVFSIQEAQVFLDICVVGIQQPQGDTPGVNGVNWHVWLENSQPRIKSRCIS